MEIISFNVETGFLFIFEQKIKPNAKSLGITILVNRSSVC